MQDVKHELLTNKYTRVLRENDEDIKHNAPHHFEVWADAGQAVPKQLAKIDFQEGAIQEAGVNGVMNEDLLIMVLTRLQGFQNSQFACKENAMAITKIEEALLWLRKRTMGRENRGVEGTHNV